MTKKYDISNKSDMRNLVRDIKSTAMNEIKEQVLNMSYPVTCPNCKAAVSIPPGLNYCPICRAEINLNLSTDF